ncbi:MAG: SDR family NAD(P)-dependent oxidoreductase, partial [Gammaproteobacteria bacterium]
LKLRGIAVETLVNNAGYGVPGGFMRQTAQTHQDFQQVLVNAVIALCYAFIPDMQSRRRGTIINIASLAGLVPASAGHTLYGAAKAWLIKFTEALSPELAPYGIKVLALCPGFTLTEFHDVNGMRAEVSRLPRWLWMSAADVVSEGLAAVERDAMVYVPGRINRVIAAGARLLPARLALALIARPARDFRRVD